ncbi:MAG: hypothetical protein MSC31_02565 [Solirubrobacteraceae bacterium MAG38_C4-C5]|nr:hypothetical protein [Candidatus Siliceabacter maunaloa]
MLRRAPLITLLAAAALAGCGPAAGQDSAEDFTGPPREVVATVEALQEAASARDAQSVCSNLLAASVQDDLRATRTPCAEAVEDALTATDVVELEVPRDGVRIQGAQARVRVEVGAREGAIDTVTFAMVREGSNWKLAGIEGAAPPGGGPQG